MEDAMDPKTPPALSEPSEAERRLGIATALAEIERSAPGAIARMRTAVASGMPGLDKVRD